MWDVTIIAAFIGAAATVLTAAVAIFIFFKQQTDKKRQAAKALFSEITQFEKFAQEIKADKLKDPFFEIDPNKYFLSKSTWESSKFLFIDDFDSVQWERLETFFRQREIFDKTIQAIRSLHPENVRARMKIIHDQLGKLAMNYSLEKQEILGGNSTPEEEQEKLNVLEKKYNQIFNIFIEGLDVSRFGYSYKPKGTYSFINAGIELVDTDISISVIGDKLKSIADLKRKN